MKFKLAVFFGVGALLLIVNECFAASPQLQIISEDVRLDNPNKMNLPSSLAGLDSKLNFLIAETDKFYGVKSFEGKKLGFKLYDKACNLIWSKKFDDRKFDYLDVKISETGEIIIFILGKAVDLGPYFRGIDIYERSFLSGYKKTGNVEFVSFTQDLVIDEGEKLIYTSGYFPDLKTSKDLKIVCLSLNGEITWQNKSPIEGYQNFELFSSSDFMTFMVLSDISHPLARIATIIDHNGNIIGKIQKEPYIKAALSKSGEIVALSRGNNLSLYSTKPFKEQIEVKFDELLGVDISGPAIAIGISETGDFIILAVRIKEKDIDKIKLVMVDKDGNRTSDFYLPDQILSVTDIQFESKSILKINSQDKTWRVSLED